MSLKKNLTGIALSLILVFTIAVSMVAVVSPVQALDIPTFPLLTCAPNPVGVGQIVYINAFMSKPTPTAGMASSGDQYENIMIHITRPDGTQQTIGPLRSDSTGGTWASFTPTQEGAYKLQMTYPGQTLIGGGDVFGGGGQWNGSILLPSTSEVITLTVQRDSIVSPYSSPNQPTEYWSRPIYSTNWYWGELGGNWLGLRAPSFATTGMYDVMGNFQQYSKAPNTGHIVWTRPTQFGGIVGGPISSDQESQYTSTSIAINYFEPIIMYGIIYYTQFSSVNSNPSSWEAVDLRTGETVWSRTCGDTGKEVLRMGQILRFHTVQEFGSTPFLWSTEIAGFFQTPSFYSLYDASTGKFVCNITGIQNLSYYTDVDETQQGTLLGWYASGGNLTMWNSTRMLTSGPSMFGPVVVTIRPTGTYNYSTGVQWTVPLATTLGGAPISGTLGVAASTPEVILTRYYPSPGMFQEMGYGYQITAGYNAKTGALMWGPLNQTLPYLHDIAVLAARDGVYVIHDKDANEAYGFSLTNGVKLWGPVKLPGNAWSSISRAAEIAYGHVYIWDFGGYVNALDMNTGEIKWTFTPRSSGYDAPYGIYPLWHFGTQSIADGKLFFSEGSMYNPPIHPAYRLAIDAYTGDLVWKLLSYSGRCPGAIADGYLLQWNSFDSQLYSIGKGPTATTIVASPKVTTAGSSMLIEGRVTDESPGTKNTDRLARFPDGVPAIADDCMSDWMEYVYMQQTKPTDITGVPVTLLVTDPTGTTQEIATVTSNAKGNFAYSYIPPTTGLYTISAVFCGSESYFGSESETAFVASAANPVTSPTIAPTVAPTTTLPPTVAPTFTIAPSPTVAPTPGTGLSTETLLIAGAAVVIIIAVIAAALVLRKRK